MSTAAENPLAIDPNAGSAVSAVVSAPAGDVASNSAVNTRRAELEATLRGLKDGSLTEEQAAVAMDRLVASQISEGIDGLRAELTSANTLHAMIKTAVAHLSEAPTNCAVLLHAVCTFPWIISESCWHVVRLLQGTKQRYSLRLRKTPKMHR
eukprot:COSAG02_NODE_76_length_41115_cov_60.967817_5_plen_152_part_00